MVDLRINRDGRRFPLGIAVDKLADMRPQQHREAD